MYSRKVTTSPRSIVKNGSPVFGSFSNPPAQFDISDVRFPFGFSPFPSFITNLRIRGNISYSFSADKFVGNIQLFDAKFLCFLELVLWDKSTGKKLSYRSIFGMRRLLPKNMDKAVCATYSRKRHVRIGWNRGKNRVSVSFNISGDSVRPAIDGLQILDTGSDSAFGGELFCVRPATTSRRCVASWFCAAPFSGRLANKKTDTVYRCNAPDGIGLLDMRRAYYKLRTKDDFLYGMDVVGGKTICFRMTATNYDAPDANTYNENVLFADKEMTLLPPVTITRPYGISGKWVIQDTENMVDLFFTPISDNHRVDSIFVLRTDYHTIYGTFEGDLRTSSGEILHLKGFTGIARKQYLRM